MQSIRQVQRLNELELEKVVPPNASWHTDYRDTAYIYIGGLPFELSEGDVLTIFSQYGNPVHVNLVRDKETGKSRGFCFLKYEDQRSCDLAVDNLSGAGVMGRVISVDHTRYKKKEGEVEGIGDEQEEEDADATDREGDERRKRRKTESESEEERPLIKEELELAKLKREMDDDDPMKAYLIKEKQEEVAAAKKKKDRSERERQNRHRQHRSRRDDDGNEDGDRRKKHRRGATAQKHQRPTRRHDIAVVPVDDAMGVRMQTHGDETTMSETSRPGTTVGGIDPGRAVRHRAVQEEIAGDEEYLGIFLTVRDNPAE